MVTEFICSVTQYLSYSRLLIVGKEDDDKDLVVTELKCSVTQYLANSRLSMIHAIKHDIYAIRHIVVHAVMREHNAEEYTQLGVKAILQY